MCNQHQRDRRAQHQWSCCKHRVCTEQSQPRQPFSRAAVQRAAQLNGLSCKLSFRGKFAVTEQQDLELPEQMPHLSFASVAPVKHRGPSLCDGVNPFCLIGSVSKNSALGEELASQHSRLIGVGTSMLIFTTWVPGP